ncbi:MAG: DUF2069 domain-containing protein [Proteobacteria bacterium]|nr:DUF2069 domain-containing protein [Pseudomonadota bacterium]HQR02875.1 DUF2069 domain-containing protein [Rhodocyclaceae bacterium]
MNRLNVVHLSATVGLIALIFLCLAWELWWAPLRPGGSALVFKVLPLLLPLRGVLRGRRYTFQWASMMILAYFTEGVVRAASDPGTAGRVLAGVEVALTLVFFTSAVLFARWSGTGIRRLPGG